MASQCLRVKSKPWGSTETVLTLHPEHTPTCTHTHAHTHTHTYMHMHTHTCACTHHVAYLPAVMVIIILLTADIC